MASLCPQLLSGRQCSPSVVSLLRMAVSASTRFFLGKKQERALLLQLDSGVQGVQAGNELYFGSSRARPDQL